MGYNRVVTHNDFDGVVCAALCSHVFGMEFFFYTGPRDIHNNRHPVTVQDIVADLPYPLECGMWFDHHPGNLEDVKLRGLDPKDIPGRFHPDPSCARTVYDYFSEEWDLADYLADTVYETDIIDSFDYSSIEDWRSPTAGKNVDASIKAPFKDGRHRNRYLKQVSLWVRDNPLDKIQHFPYVVSQRKQFEELEEHSVTIIRQCSRFLEEDTNEELIILDLTEYRQRPNIARHMAFLEYPEAKAVIVVGNPIVDGKKSTNISFSMSLSVLMNNQEHSKNIGDIMRSLNIGDGHAGAAAGAAECNSKDEMLKARESTLAEIYTIWQNQVVEG